MSLVISLILMRNSDKAILGHHQKNNYMKQEVLDKLKEARNLVTEAKNIIEDLASKYNILDTRNMDVLKEVTDLIKILSEIKRKTKGRNGKTGN